MGVCTMARSLLYMLLVPAIQGSGPGLIRQDLPASTYPAAVCNDGSQANYHHQPGVSHGKILISLQGGGTCDTIESCQQRCANTDLCTAQTDQQMVLVDTLADQVHDPFHDYWHVQVHYCSSDTWAGTKPADGSTGGYYFHGKYIFQAVIQDLATNFNLLDATHIVLTGGSAGAQGAIFNCDDLAEWVWAQIAFFAPNCRIHGIGLNQGITVKENESGELVDLPTFLTQWMEGDGNVSLHANDDISVENHSCPSHPF